MSGKKGVISAEFYKIKHCRLLWFVPIFFMAVGFYYASFDYKVFRLYDRLELFVLPTLAGLYFISAAAVVTGYVIGLDFSESTIRNVLSVGVDRKTYFFSRLGVQFLLTALMYGVAMLAYGVGRLYFFPSAEASPRPEMELFGAKLAVFSAITILQLWAEVSLVNTICYFARKQLAAMGAGMLLVYAELVLRQVADMYGVALVRGIFDFTPVKVLKYSFDKYAAYNRVFTFDFLKYGISALVILAVSIAIGNIKFQYFSENT